jgi:hypothetical protein
MSPTLPARKLAIVFDYGADRHLREIDKPRQGVVANTLNVFRNGASLLANAFGVGFIDWLGRMDIMAQLL